MAAEYQAAPLRWVPEIHVDNHDRIWCNFIHCERAKAPIAEQTFAMKKYLAFMSVCLLSACAEGEVRVFVQDIGGVAWIKYECTAGELVRAFALNVSVNKGKIVGISDFFRGTSTAGARGYGIFPAAFRDHITAGLGTNIDWNVSGYTPLAVAADRPADTLPGLNSSGVTLEFGGLWDPTVPAAMPDLAGTLCALQISQPAQVSVDANLARGGVVSAISDVVLAPIFSGAAVAPPFPAITGVTLVDGLLTVYFKDGELLTAPTLSGPWTGTGNTSGTHTTAVQGTVARFYRVRRSEVVTPFPAITGVTLVNGLLTIRFQDGELLSAPTVAGPWTATGNTSGVFTNAVGGTPAGFYRVRR
jgi:hypothetical protein